MSKREKRMFLILCLLMKNLGTFYPFKDVIFSLVLMHNLIAYLMAILACVTTPTLTNEVCTIFSFLWVYHVDKNINVTHYISVYCHFIIQYNIYSIKKYLNELIKNSIKDFLNN